VVQFSGSTIHDLHGNAVCAPSAVSEEYLLEKFDTSLKQLLTPQRLALLRDEVRRQDEAERNPEAVEQLQKRLAELNSNIDRGTERLLLLSADMLEGAEAKIRQWKDERDGVAQQLEALAGPGRAADLEDGIRATESLLWRWRELVQAEDVVLLRELVSEVVQRIEVSWTRKPTRGKRTRYLVDAENSAIHVHKHLLCGSEHGKPWMRTISGPLPSVT
jgi:hypothetical protein